MRAKDNNPFYENRINKKTLRILLSFTLLSLPLYSAFSQNINKEKTGTSVNTPEKKSLFNQAELDQMLAPIALYLDAILAQILMAATYPAEIQQAAAWTRGNSGMKPLDAINTVSAYDWDSSVKSLIVLPELLERMADQIEWTMNVGDAFWGQQEQVMKSIQFLRTKAWETGSLVSNDKIRVKTAPDAITIETVSPEIIYVPYYNPNQVYGYWWWPNSPPFAFQPWSYYKGAYAPLPYQVAWGYGAPYSYHWFFGGFDWNRRVTYVTVRNDYYVTNRPEIWRHNPVHRHNVPYYKKNQLPKNQAFNPPSVQVKPKPQKPMHPVPPPSFTEPSHKPGSSRPSAQKPEQGSPDRPGSPKPMPPQGHERPQSQGHQGEKPTQKPSAQKVPDRQKEPVTQRPQQQKTPDHSGNLLPSRPVSPKAPEKQKETASQKPALQRPVPERPAPQKIVEQKREQPAQRPAPQRAPERQAEPPTRTQERQREQPAARPAPQKAPERERAQATSRESIQQAPERQREIVSPRATPSQEADRSREGRGPDRQ